METTGEKIKRLRKSKGLSLMELADILSISDTGLLKIETGKTKSITVDLGKKMSKALDISFNELFDIEIIINKDEEIQKVKELLFLCMSIFRYSTEHSKEMILIENVHSSEYEKISNDVFLYIDHLREFEFNFAKTLVNMGFCTLDEIKKYHEGLGAHTSHITKEQVMLYAEFREDVKKQAIEKGLPYP